MTGGRHRDSVTSDALESVIGAVYLDGGFANAKEFVLKYVLNDMEHKKLFFDSKTIFQEMVQGNIPGEISYHPLDESGGTLLSTLANNNVFLPSACGGGGSCGMCKCQVLEGGGELLPTETGFINRKMAKEHWRLGCQVKVKENLKIHVPESVLGVKKWECEVISNRNISTFLKEFVVKLPEGENLKFRSGGYIQIDIPKYDAIKFSDMDIEEPYREDWDKMKMWDLVTKNPEQIGRASCRERV